MTDNKMKPMIKTYCSFTEFQDVLPLYACLRGEYFEWNLRSRYDYNPDFVTKQLEKRGETLEELLETYRQMQLSYQLPQKRYEQLIRDFETGQCILLCFVNSILVGCMRLKTHTEEEAYLHSVFVSPTYRKKQLASMMMTQTIQLARRKGFSTILLDTLPFMTEAIRLYRKFGFELLQNQREVSKDLASESIFMQRDLVEN